MNKYELPQVEQWEERIEQAASDIQAALRVYQPTSEQFYGITYGVIYDLVRSVVGEVSGVFVDRAVQESRESFAVLTQAVFSGVFNVSVGEEQEGAEDG